MGGGANRRGAGGALARDGQDIGSGPGAPCGLTGSSAAGAIPYAGAELVAAAAVFCKSVTPLIPPRHPPCPGAVVGIIGGNGAGKSTLFRMIMGVQAPDAGGLRLGDTVVPMYVDQSREALQVGAGCGGGGKRRGAWSGTSWVSSHGSLAFSGSGESGHASRAALCMRSAWPACASTTTVWPVSPTTNLHYADPPPHLALAPAVRQDRVRGDCRWQG